MTKVFLSAILLAGAMVQSGAFALGRGPSRGDICNGTYYGGYPSGGSLPMTLSTDWYGNLQVSTLGTDGRYYYGQGTCDIRGNGPRQIAYVNFNLNMGSYYIPYSGSITWQGWNAVFQGRQNLPNGNQFVFIWN